MAAAQAPKISSRVAARVAWTLWGVTTAVVALGMVLVVLTRSVPNSGYATWYLWLLFMLGYLSFPTVGLIIAVRRPANPLGWLLLGMGLTLGLNDGMHAYGNYALVYKPGALPAGLAIGWVSTWNWALIFPLFPFLFLLFPDGRLPSRRWRPAAWGAGLLGGLVVLLCPFRAGPLEYFPKIQNPTGIHALSQSAFSTLTFIYLIVLLTNHGFLGGPLPPGPRRRTPAAQVGSGGRSRVGSHRDRRGKVAAVVPQLAAVGGDSGDLCRRDRGGDLEVSAL